MTTVTVTVTVIPSALAASVEHPRPSAEVRLQNGPVPGGHNVDAVDLGETTKRLNARSERGELQHLFGHERRRVGCLPIRATNRRHGVGVDVWIRFLTPTFTPPRTTRSRP